MGDQPLTLRPGGPDDLEWLLGLFDEAVAWMVARGQERQWGAEPWSQTPARRDGVSRLIGGGGLRVAVRDGQDVGALIVGEAPAHVPAADEPELYIELLLVSRHHAGLRIGEWLVQRAVDEARQRGLGRLRVDCWAGAPTLVAWYEARGFQRTTTFEVDLHGGWTGQVFAMAV
jgi:GNAT superfamily N-acetyltransferase